MNKVKQLPCMQLLIISFSILCIGISSSHAVGQTVNIEKSDTDIIDASVDIIGNYKSLTQEDYLLRSLDLASWFNDLSVPVIESSGLLIDLLEPTLYIPRQSDCKQGLSFNLIHIGYAVRKLARFPLEAIISANDFDAMRRKYADILTQYSERLDRRIIPGYTQKIVYINVIPTMCRESCFPGMAIDALRTNAEKESYKAAIDLNNENTINNRLQYLYQRSKKEAAVEIGRFLKRVFTKRMPDPEKMKYYLNKLQ